ncbi:conserved hypothetical protein [Thiomonas sp. X19]|nr:conserved hypothetical protein [Thiomonas sp. X19]
MENALTPASSDLLLRLARTYIWWKEPEDAMLYPRRLVAQIMDMGDWDDVRAMEKALGHDALRDALRHAEAGWFSPPSWHFWHYRLGLVSPNQSMPALPQRLLS